METTIMNISGIDCYEKDGTAYLKLEAVARGLGFTRTADSGNEVVRWERLGKYLSELGVPTCGHDAFIPENIFYRLAMKAKNETAEKFQAFIADEVIPSIRKHGAYMTSATIDKMIASPEFGIQLLTALKEEQDKRKALEGEVKEMQPKADYFDELVDRNLLTNFRDTAKELHVKQKEFIEKLLELGYIYRDQKNKLQPYQQHVDKGLFELKECKGNSSKWCGTQTLITPRGRETFRLLFVDKQSKYSIASDEN